MFRAPKPDLSRCPPPYGISTSRSPDIDIRRSTTIPICKHIWSLRCVPKHIFLSAWWRFIRMDQFQINRHSKWTERDDFFDSARATIQHWSWSQGNGIHKGFPLVQGAEHSGAHGAPANSTMFTSDHHFDPQVSTPDFDVEFRHRNPPGSNFDVEMQGSKG